MMFLANETHVLRRETNDCDSPLLPLPFPSFSFDVPPLPSFCLVHLTDHTYLPDAFAIRQFTDPNYTGTKVEYDPQEFEDKVRQNSISAVCTSS